MRSCRRRRLLHCLCLGSSLAADEPGLAQRRRSESSFSATASRTRGSMSPTWKRYLRLHDPKFAIEFVNCGLSSETVSGLSEDGHAGGKFPRPDVHERLDRVLAGVKPDLVVACYGMNCGIYSSAQRRALCQVSRRNGTACARNDGGRREHVLHITPPVFDPVPIKARRRCRPVATSTRSRTKATTTCSTPTAPGSFRNGPTVGTSSIRIRR